MGTSSSDYSSRFPQRKQVNKILLHIKVKKIIRTIFLITLYVCYFADITLKR